MAGKITITIDNNGNANIKGDLKENDLYRAYIAMTGYMAGNLADWRMIHGVAKMAAEEASKLISLKILEKEKADAAITEADAIDPNDATDASDNETADTSPEEIVSGEEDAAKAPGAGPQKISPL